MTIFNNLIGKEIHRIKRIDTDESYSFGWTWGLYFVTQESPELGLCFAACQDGESIDISVEFGSELLAKNEDKTPAGLSINDLIPGDELMNFVGKEIQKIRLARSETKEIKGDSFSILQRLYVAAQLVTDSHSLTFYNQDCGVLEINKTDKNTDEEWSWEE